MLSTIKVSTKVYKMIYLQASPLPHHFIHICLKQYKGEKLEVGGKTFFCIKIFAYKLKLLIAKKLLSTNHKLLLFDK